MSTSDDRPPGTSQVPASTPPPSPTPAAAPHPSPTPAAAPHQPPTPPRPHAPAPTPAPAPIPPKESSFPAVVFAATAVAAGLFLVLQAVDTLVDASRGSLTVALSALDPGDLAPLAPAPPAGLSALVADVAVVLDPAQLSPLAVTLLLVGTVAWTLTGLAGLLLLAVVGWRLFKGTLFTAVPHRLLEWSATACLLAALVALGGQTLGTNTALRDLGYAADGGDSGYTSFPLAGSPWVWLAIFWGIMLVSRAWATGRQMAQDTEGLV